MNTNFDIAADRLFETGNIDFDRISLAHQFILQHRERRLAKVAIDDNSRRDISQQQVNFSKIDSGGRIEKPTKKVEAS